MYDELVKRLRNEAETERYLLPHSDNGTAALLDNAADAIEELSADCDMYRKGMTDEHNRAAKLAWDKEHCWIPVTERLPEENAPCIVYNKYYGPMVGWRVDGERFRIPGSRFPDHPTHWMTLPKPPKEK